MYNIVIIDFYWCLLLLLYYIFITITVLHYYEIVLHL